MNKKILSVFLCIIMITIVFSAISVNSDTYNNTLILIRVDKENYDYLRINNYEIVGSKIDKSFDVIIPRYKLKNFDILKIDYILKHEKN